MRYGAWLVVVKSLLKRLLAGLVELLPVAVVGLRLRCTHLLVRLPGPHLKHRKHLRRLRLQQRLSPLRLNLNWGRLRA